MPIATTTATTASATGTGAERPRVAGHARESCGRSRTAVTGAAILRRRTSAMKRARRRTAVTIPTCSSPGRATTRPRTSATSSSDGAEQRRVGQHPALVGAGDRPRDVRHGEADEDDRPGRGGGAAAQQRDGDRARDPDAAGVGAERPGRRRRRARARSAAGRAAAPAARRATMNGAPSAGRAPPRWPSQVADAARSGSGRASRGRAAHAVDERDQREGDRRARQREADRRRPAAEPRRCRSRRRATDAERGAGEGEPDVPQRLGEPEAGRSR